MIDFTNEELEKLKEKKSFLLYKDSLNDLDEMTDEQAGQFFKILYSYQIDGVMPDIREFHLKLFVNIFRNQFDRENKEWLKTCERNKNNRNKSKNNQSSQVVTTGTYNDTDTDTDPDTYTDNGKVNIITDKNKHPFFFKWLEYNKEKKHPINSNLQLGLVAEEINNHSFHEVKTVINKSISGGYKALFWKPTEEKKAFKKPESRFQSPIL